MVVVVVIAFLPVSGKFKSNPKSKFGYSSGSTHAGEASEVVTSFRSTVLVLGHPAECEEQAVLVRLVLLTLGGGDVMSAPELDTFITNSKAIHSLNINIASLTV